MPEINLISLGSKLVFEGQLIAQAGANWTVEVGKFVVGNENDLLAYCASVPAPTESFVVVSRLLEAYPIEGLVTWSRVGERIHLSLQVGGPWRARDASKERDMDLTKIGQHDDTISGAPMVERIVSRLLGWGSTKIWKDPVLVQWRSQPGGIDETYADELVRLAVTLVLRAPSHQATSEVTPRSTFIAKVLAVAPGEVTTRQDGSLSRRTRISVSVGGVDGDQTWDLDVRL